MSVVCLASTCSDDPRSGFIRIPRPLSVSLSFFADLSRQSPTVYSGYENICLSPNPYENTVKYFKSAYSLNFLWCKVSI